MTEPTWSDRAKTFMEAALEDMGNKHDAIPNASAALACLRIECGEQPPDDDLADLADGNAEPDCTCPPDLVARGGFTSSCAFHRMR